MRHQTLTLTKIFAKNWPVFESSLKYLDRIKYCVIFFAKIVKQKSFFFPQFSEFLAIVKFSRHKLSTKRRRTNEGSRRAFAPSADFLYTDIFRFACWYGAKRVIPTRKVLTRNVLTRNVLTRNVLTRKVLLLEIT